MSDMAGVIVPKSDQLNADDLIAGPMTITVTDVKIKSGEQPVSIYYEGDKGKPYKCCKSMARILVASWGPDSKKYVGRSMTLYRDPSVKWAGMEVGGIRISHLSDIEESMTMALTMTRSNRKPFTVKPLAKAAGAPTNAAVVEKHVNSGKSLPLDTSGAEHRPDNGIADSAANRELGTQSATITPDQAAALEVRCNENDIPVDRLKVAAKVTRLAQIKASDYGRAVAWLDKAIAAKKEAV